MCQVAVTLIAWLCLLRVQHQINKFFNLFRCFICNQSYMGYFYHRTFLISSFLFGLNKVDIGTEKRYIPNFHRTIINLNTMFQYKGALFVLFRTYKLAIIMAL